MTQAGTGPGGHDYVIVGAGSAGAVLAARLSEDPGVRVLLLEAGPEAEGDEISIPVAFSTLFKTRWDWNYTTTEQKQLHNRRAFWPRMKALGGCSSMNANIYIRGNAAGMEISSASASGPASSSSTRTAGSSLSLAASTAPALPAPTMT